MTGLLLFIGRLDRGILLWTLWLHLLQNVDEECVFIFFDPEELLAFRTIFGAHVL